MLLASVEPHKDYLACDYRAGTDPRLPADAVIRYQFTLMKATARITPASVFKDVVAQDRAGLRIRGDHIPPLATGPAPAPTCVAYWDTESVGVQGLWVGKAGSWVVSLRARYPASAANDDEAGRVARTLFAEASTLK